MKYKVLVNTDLFVKACNCDADVSHQKRPDDLDLTKVVRAFIELNSRRMEKHCKFCYYN